MARKSKAKRRTGRGAILLIALMLVSSGIMRVASGSGEAVAQALSAAGTESAKGESAIIETQNPIREAASLDRNEVSTLLGALREREERVRQREAQIEMRSKALAVADSEIKKRLKTLEEAEANLRQTLSLADGAAEDDLARLTSVYESMKPKDAAALFQTMEPDFAAGFLGRMRPDAAGAVMAGLPPDIAYSISVILAGRNAKAPKS